MAKDLKELGKEIPCKWRIQSIGYGKAKCVAYLDARDVEDLLDEVVEPQNWQCEYYEMKGNLFCKIGIMTAKYCDACVGTELEHEDWTWKSDCGSESNIEKEKGEASDAFKRAAVRWGVGRFMYRFGIIEMGVGKHTNGKEYPQTKDGKILFNGEQLTEYINSKRKQQ